MTCRGLAELVTEYLEGRLTWRQRVAFQWHLGICKHCRAWLRQMRKTVADLGHLPEPQIPAELEAELLQKFRRWHKDPHSAQVPPDTEPLD
jgi:anti-sigma factor RsiW